MLDDLRPLGNADLSHKRPVRLGRFLFGSAYYPEHWDESFYERDAERMAAAGWNVVRMGEFAWDRMEPEEGRFDFAFFDRAIERLGRRGVSTILCTPTATPPRWLTVAHPEVLRVDADGRPMQHGSRQHACHASPVFRDYSRAITRAMAEHFRDDERVIGWQTDNELHCHFSECHCGNCQAAFQDHLRRKFRGDVSELNATWGTAFWAQTYRRFEDVPTPRPSRPTHLNPAHVLDYYRFLYDAVARFQHDQVEILRAVNRRWFVTHNGTMRHVDYRGLFTRDLDFLGHDVYPMFVHDPDVRPGAEAFWLDWTRAWSGNFIVPEQQSGPGGQPPYMHDTPEPGEMRRMTYASIARGADSLLYFRWRTCRFGAEQYWCGVLDHDDVPRRRYAEAAQVGRELAAIGPEVLGTSVFVDAAVAAADVEVSDAHATYSLGLPGPDDIASRVHKTLCRRGFAVGCVHPSDDLTDVKLFIIPHWALFDPGWVPGLTSFVRRGGTLVVSARTATRSLANNVVGEPLPGCLRDLAGVTVEEYGRQNRPDKRPLSIACRDRVAPTDLWYEALACSPGSEPLAAWRGRHLDGLPAVSCRAEGRGHVLYVGTYLTERVTELLLPDLVRLSGLKPLWPEAPVAVSVSRRLAPGREVWFFINESDARAEIARTPVGTDLVTGLSSGGPLALEPNGVAVVATQGEGTEHESA